MHWPGAVHEGGGKHFIIVDESADEDQRQALLTILSGGDRFTNISTWRWTWTRGPAM
jgi:hypothetical protein